MNLPKVKEKARKMFGIVTVYSPYEICIHVIIIDDFM